MAIFSSTKLAAGAAVSIAVCLAVFASQPALSDYQANEAKSNDSLQIGFIVPFTGALAAHGEAIRNGVILAAESSSEVRNTVSAVYEDSRYDSKAATASYRKLQSANNINAVYLFGGPMSDALAPIAERAKLPIYSTEYDTALSAGRDYVVRFANNGQDYAAVLLDNLRKRNFRKFGIIKVENQYHNTLVSAFSSLIKDEEQLEILYNFHPGDNNFRAAIAKLKQADIDALGVYLTPGMQHAFFAQLRATNLRPPLFGTDSLESREANRNVEELVEGAVFANSYVNEEFESRYRKRFGNISQLAHAALAYEFVSLAAANLSSGKCTEKFVECLEFSGRRQSALGEYYFRNSAETGRYYSFPIALREVRQGEAKVRSVHPAP